MVGSPLLFPVIALLAYRFFGTLSAAVVVALWTLAAISPSLSFAVLFLILSVDVYRPVFGLFFDFSEFELAACLLGTVFGWGIRRRALDWRPLWWWGPFAAMALLSGSANDEGFRAVPLVVRLGEMSLLL